MNKRHPLIAGNWKMNKTPAKAQEFVSELMPLVSKAFCEIVICPPTIDIPAVASRIKDSDSNIRLGAQNVHWMESGAYTGETSVCSLVELKVSHVIVGHSERRSLFGDTDETVNLRARAALAAGLTPIICVGETGQERENNATEAVLHRQTKAAFANMTRDEALNTIIAYEPVWAIGTGKTATANDANDTIAIIRELIAQLYDEHTRDSIRILYGGSMNAKNADSLMAMPEIDGGLIGGASLNALDFAAIIAAADKT